MTPSLDDYAKAGGISLASKKMLSCVFRSQPYQSDEKVTVGFVVRTKWTALNLNLLNGLYACPHGVIAMSQTIPNFVETSTNLASCKKKEGYFFIQTSQRSSIESSKQDIANMVEAVWSLADADVEHTDGYPGWAPNPNSAILDVAVKCYKERFNKDPKVRAIHAGLECGLIGDKIPGMDMISFGPTLRGVHSPDERCEIATVQMFWDFMCDILKNVPTIEK